ncbi:hypothetical protein AZG88_02985 [Rhodococcus sp. LB1]|nr:hypothetical protein AZG88_02985 [Rhodococcus sp. LB1]
MIAAKTALELMVTEQITIFAGVPTMYWALLGAVDESVDVEQIARTLRRAISGGAALPVEILTRFSERFGVRILEGYGLSETSPLAMFSDPERDPRPGSIGVPVWGVEAMHVDKHWNPVLASELPKQAVGMGGLRLPGGAQTDIPPRVRTAPWGQSGPVVEYLWPLVGGEAAQYRVGRVIVAQQGLGEPVAAEPAHHLEAGGVVGLPLQVGVIDRDHAPTCVREQVLAPWPQRHDHRRARVNRGGEHLM